MTDPDEFPLKGTWSVNERISTKFLFITEAHGDGTSEFVLLTAEDYPETRGYARIEPKYKALLEQICARHNEGIREEEG